MRLTSTDAESRLKETKHLTGELSKLKEVENAA